MTATFPRAATALITSKDTQRGPFLAALAILLCLSPAARADWPHLRGPNYDGVSAETGLADAWPGAGPPQLWTRSLNQGYSGFTVVEGRLYTQRQTLGGQYLLCLDPDTGQTVWESRYDRAWQPQGPYPGPYASPTCQDGKVYYTSPTGLVGCVDGRTGNALWSVNLSDRFHGQGWDFGYAATPLVENELVILPVGGPDAGLVALHADDGRTAWTAGSDPASYCPAFPITVGGRRCVVGYLQNVLLLVDLATGKVLHRRQLSSGYDEHSAWPLYQEPDLLVVGPLRAAATCMRLQPGAEGSLSCRPLWTSRRLSNDVVSSVLYRGHVFGFDLNQLQASRHRASHGAFNCLNWADGKVCWSTDRVGQAAALAADGKLFLVNDTGTLILARADPAAYDELARTRLFDDEICWTPPTLWHGRLFVRSPSQAVCVYVGPGEDAPPGSSSAPSEGSPGRSWRFDATSLLSREREYPNDAPTLEEMTLWFGACVLLVFGGAALGAGLVLLTARRLFGRRLPRSGIFLGLAFVLGLLGPNVFSALADRCLFTWPASLYAAFQAALLACWWAERQAGKRRARWAARLAILGLLLASYAFFEGCTAVGMFVGWAFLCGFVPGFTPALLAVRADVHRQPFGVVVGWTVLGFAAFFWSCEGVLLWKAARGT